MKFLIDSMLPPGTADLLNAAGHDATTPVQLGAHNLPDDVLIEVAAADGRVIVTENASDLATSSTCTVLLVRKSWWPSTALAQRLATAINRWATANQHPGLWPYWLPSDLR